MYLRCPSALRELKKFQQTPRGTTSCRPLQVKILSEYMTYKPKHMWGQAPTLTAGLSSVQVAATSLLPNGWRQEFRNSSKITSRPPEIVERNVFHQGKAPKNTRGVHYTHTQVYTANTATASSQRKNQSGQFEGKTGEKEGPEIFFFSFLRRVQGLGSLQQVRTPFLLQGTRVQGTVCIFLLCREEQE